MPESLRKWLPLMILAGATLVAAAVMLLAPTPPTREAPEVLPIVRVAEVHPETVTLTVRAQGSVQAVTETTLVSQVAGEIVRTGDNLAAGAMVERGEILALIEPRDYELAVTQAEVNLARARTALEVEQARAEIAREEWTGLGKGEPPPLAAREPQITEAKAAVAAAEASLEQARLNLRRTRVAAPYRARVRAKLADRGQYVTPGAPIAELVGIDQAEIPLPVEQGQLRFLDAAVTSADALSIPVEISLDGGSSWEAEIVRSSGEIHPRSRMLTLTAVVDDPLSLESDGAVLPLGAFVDAAIRGRKAERIIVLPRSALRGTDRVLVVDADDRLRFRQVEVLRLEPDRALIDGGLEAGERVCLSPLEAPVDGMRVQIEGAPVTDEDKRAPRP